ncbi:MAG: hypothetical protein ACXVYV_03715 [Gaiellales bacterium]
MTEGRRRLLPASHDQALEELRRCAGTQFDPAVVEAACRVLRPGGDIGRIVHMRVRT